MKDLVVYYSLTGGTRIYAEDFAAKTGAELLEAQPKRPYNKFTAFTLGVFRAIRGKPDTLQPLGADLEKYGKIMLVSPVWAGNPAPAIMAVAAQLPKDKQVGVILRSAGGKSDPEKITDLIESRGCKLAGIKDVKAGE